MQPASQKPLRILIADDLPICRIFIQSILQARPDCHVISEASEGLEAVRKALELQPDLVLLDIGVPTLNGIKAAERIRQASPASIIIFVTQNNDEDVRTAALATGAQDYVLKSNAGTDLLPAIDAALRNPHRLQSVKPIEHANHAH